MLGLLKRTKIGQWETTLLLNIFEKLGEEYYKYQMQIKDNLLFRVRVYNNAINYVGFSYDPKVSKKYENRTEQQITLKGIKVFDQGINQYTNIQVHLYMGLIAGYSTPDIKKLKPDPTKFIIADFQKEYVENAEFNKVAHFFTLEEVSKINTSDIYEIELKGKIYYHFKDLEDGDFIGFDQNRKVYKITHDPFEITELNKTLSELIM